MARTAAARETHARACGEVSKLGSNEGICEQHFTVAQLLADRASEFAEDQLHFPMVEFGREVRISSTGGFIKMLQLDSFAIRIFTVSWDARLLAAVGIPGMRAIRSTGSSFHRSFLPRPQGLGFVLTRLLACVKLQPLGPGIPCGRFFLGLLSHKPCFASRNKTAGERRSGFHSTSRSRFVACPPC